MSTIQILRARADANQIGRVLISRPSAGVGTASTAIEKSLQALTAPTPTFAAVHHATASKSLEEQIYDALAAFKVRTATVAMHLDREWRSGFFQQLDSLIAVEDWEADDHPPTIASFSTFLRMLILLRSIRRPGLGASDGNFIATWTSGDDRLTIECLADDIARWNLAVTIDGERERAAGITPSLRLPDVLRPYAPERWFENAHYVRPG